MTNELRTPDDDPLQPTIPGVRPTGKRRRYRVMGEGEGDHCIYEIVGVGQPFPQGTLLPIPGVPRFESSREAISWIRHRSGDRLHGKQVMLFQAREILSLTVEAAPVIRLLTKTKSTVQARKEDDDGKRN